MSGTVVSPTWSVVQLPSRTSGAPLLNSMLDPSLRCRCTVDIILRSEVNGISARRSKRLICALGALELLCRDQERRLGGVALDAPFTVVLGELCIVGERPGAQDELRLEVVLLAERRPAAATRPRGDSRRR